MFENIYNNILSSLNSGKETALVTVLNEDNRSIVDKFSVFANTLKSTFEKRNLLVHNEDIMESFSTGLPSFHKISSSNILIEPFFPKPRLIIFGGGHIAKPLCELAHSSGFSTVVIDDRLSFANDKRFSLANKVICDNFENAFRNLHLRKSDFVVIVTRGHRHDDICIRNALNYDLSYIGMIGSKKRVKDMKSNLLRDNYTEEKINSVHAPIGISIGAITPMEIAISIISEIIKVRRLDSKDIKNSRKFNWPEFDEDVLNMLSSSTKDIAVATIISSKGSVPRKAGAKMIISQDGSVFGSIGGGCSEASIITSGRDLILSKGYSIDYVDMTGQVAEDEGMVCGGTMKVLVESF